MICVHCINNSRIFKRLSLFVVVSADVECYGNETDIEQCRHNAWGVHDCELTEAAAVTCLQEPPPDSDRR